MSKIHFNFYGFTVCIESDESNTLKKLKKDFHFFFSEETSFKLYIETKKIDSLDEIIPKGLIAKKQSFNSITYDVGELRYNDYYGKAITVFDYQSEKCKVYYSEPSLLHELIYLIVLSRQGKFFDKKGLHKVHAMGVTAHEKNLIVMMPMKGGKSTLFTEFLSKTDHGLLSDDTPLVNAKGEVLKFPIRLGLDGIAKYKELYDSIPEEYLYSLNRSEYGHKDLVDIMYFKERLSFNEASRSILVQGFRSTKDKAKLSRVSSVRMLYFLLINMIVGFGLPMVVEYFIRNNLKDHILNLGIFFKRLLASIKLLRKSESYILYLGTDRDSNFEILNKLLGR